jgi:hypothetical protein
VGQKSIPVHPRARRASKCHADHVFGVYAKIPILKYIQSVKKNLKSFIFMRPKSNLGQQFKFGPVLNHTAVPIILRVRWSIKEF